VLFRSATTTAEAATFAAATLLITFGVGRSYLFNVDQKQPRTPKECWRDIFPEKSGWSFKHFDEYHKPLGESVAFTFNEQTHGTAREKIIALKTACENDLLGDLDANCLLADSEETGIQIYFFTAGVAVVVVRLKPRNPGDTFVAVLDRIEHKVHRKAVRECVTEIGEVCTKEYFAVLDSAEQNKQSFVTEGWSLRRIREAEREDSRLSAPNFYPLFYLPKVSYDERTNSILKQVSSQPRRERQSEDARVPYEGAEVYVDWSEALITTVGTDRASIDKNRREIENNFIIALGCWQTLVLMDQNSAVFLLDTYADMLANKHRSNATAVHEKYMAYKGVSDAWLPIRWTTKRRDLFLLETIHHNWSSERWRNTIEERMKLIELHYNRLEDDQKENTGRRLAIAAAVLALFTLSSAVADMINLVDKEASVLGYALKDIDIYFSLVPAAIALVLGAGLVARILTPKVRRFVGFVIERLVRFRDKVAEQAKSLAKLWGSEPANPSPPELPKPTPPASSTPASSTPESPPAD